MRIDELSPDEDERNAAEFLKAPAQQAAADPEPAESYSIVDNFRQKNRAICPPNPHSLRSSNANSSGLSNHNNIDQRSSDNDSNSNSAIVQGENCFGTGSYGLGDNGLGTGSNGLDDDDGFDRDDNDNDDNVNGNDINGDGSQVPTQIRTRPVGRYQTEDGSSNSRGSTENEKEPSKQHATRHSKGRNEGPQPWQISFYEGVWHDILVKAKFLYRFLIHVDAAFPAKSDETLREAHDCLLQVIGEFQETDSGALDNSTSLLKFYVQLTQRL